MIAFALPPPRSLFCSLVAAALFATSTAASAAAPDDATACVSHEQPGGIDDVECAIAAAPVARTFRFAADFVGSHDDTVLALAATLDGAPLTCSEGSNTRLVGEDGEVTLVCGFTLAAGTAARFAAHVTFHHGQYMGRALTSTPTAR